MAEVVVEFNGEIHARVPLAERMVIGRDPSTDLHLDNRALSRRHAQIEMRGPAIWITDLGSQNGTFVNGERVKSEKLHMGDVIELGRYRVTIEGVEEAGDEDPVITLDGPGGQYRYLMVGPEIIIGRAPSCDIMIPHKSISRRHLRIARSGDQLTAEDLGSQNGTKMNGQRLEGAEALAIGQPLQMSEFSIQIDFMETEPAQAEPGVRPNNTMMIDRSRLEKKAAFVDGDFSKLEKSGLYSDSAASIPAKKDTGVEHSDYGEAAASGSGSAAGAPGVAPWVEVSHPASGPSSSQQLPEGVTIFAEDGSSADHTGGRLFADQGYLLISRSGASVSACVVGDRQLVQVNGKPHLFYKLSEGDKVEFHLLTLTYHE